MNFIFNLSCAFDDDTSASYFFVLDEKASGNLHFQGHDRPECIAYQNWMGATAGKFEDRFNAVLDFSGTSDDSAWIDGFNTYEIQTPQEAYEVAQAWREAYIDFLGSDDGVSAVVCFEDDMANDIDSQSASQALDTIRKTLGASTPANPARPSP